MKTKDKYSYRLYVPIEKETTVKDFLAICKRENSSGSVKVLEFMTEYVGLHRDGNPQTLIPRYADVKLLQVQKKSCKRLRRKGEFEGKLGWCLFNEHWVTEEDCEGCGRQHP